MDSHVFRRLCEELGPALSGCRLEKIHQPGPSVTLFTFHGRQGKRFLYLKAERKAPFLFLTEHRMSSGETPPAEVMRLRKHLKDRHVIETVADWTQRRLWLHLSTRGEAEAIWLLLDLREGPRLAANLPEEEEALWPTADELQAAGSEDWRRWPVCSPALRRTLALLPPEEQAALLVDLEAGGGDLFLEEGEDGSRELSAWPLPDELLKGRREQAFSSALEAAALAGETQVLREVAARASREAARAHQAEAARLERLLEKLENEEKRLETMRDARQDALAIKAELWKFRADEKLARFSPEEENGEGERRIVTLDPRLSLRENMAALFHRAQRGERGLARLAGRREAVREELERARQNAEYALSGGLGGPGGLKKAAAQRKSPPETRKGGQPPKGKAWPKNVQAFRSSDGFLILRGRDSAGNMAALRMAAPHDFWIHVGGGPGAHVILRRDHPAQDVPQTTLEEAAGLALLKSWRRGEGPSEVVVALAGHVHAVKGSREAKVDRYREGLRADPDPDLETRLAL